MGFLLLVRSKCALSGISDFLAIAMDGDFI